MRSRQGRADKGKVRGTDDPKKNISGRKETIPGKCRCPAGEEKRPGQGIPARWEAVVLRHTGETEGRISAGKNGRAQAFFICGRAFAAEGVAIRITGALPARTDDVY